MKRHTAARRTVSIECYVDVLPAEPKGKVAVAVDVLRSATTAITAVELGRRCFPVGTLDRAMERAQAIGDALLVGELGGNMPYGFDFNNSPASLARRHVVSRPVVLLSTSGTGLMEEVQRFEAGYVACLRNVSATARHLAANHADVLLLAAATRGEFREEDKICCARIAASLLGSGFEPVGDAADLVATWKDAPLDSIRTGKSGRYLRDTGQLEDLDFVLEHVDDLNAMYRMTDGELVAVAGGISALRPAGRPGLSTTP